MPVTFLDLAGLPFPSQSSQCGISSVKATLCLPRTRDLKLLLVSERALCAPVVGTHCSQLCLRISHVVPLRLPHPARLASAAPWAIFEMMDTQSLLYLVTDLSRGCPVVRSDDSLESRRFLGVSMKLFTITYVSDNHRARITSDTHEDNLWRSEVAFATLPAGGARTPRFKPLWLCDVAH